MEYKNVTREIWKTGRERGMSNAEIRDSWKSLWHEVSQEVYQYNDEIEDQAISGINAIFNEIEGTIHTYTKSPATENAEMVSLDNIKSVVNAAVDQAGAVPAFNAFSKLYDNGAGEWIQRIVAAIYDRELAEWSSGMPAYMSRLQSEITNEMSRLTGEKIDTSDIDFQDVTETITNNDNVETDNGFYLDVGALKQAWDEGLF